MSVPAQVQELVERFDRHLDDYKRGKYNETQVRREFIDPFFKVMGWDIDNTQGYAEAYKEVVHEDAIKIGRATKAPDYSFRIGGVRKFFLEAKKPSVDIKRDTHPAYQLRRYAWSAKLPLSILTDFEEFAVYDGRIKPDKADQATAARVMYLTYTDYLDQWPALVDIFSPESIKRGSFDKYVESKAAKRGTAEVDTAFLQEIERWRDVLARNFALRNHLTPRQLNYAVQQTIDRLIFLRIAEDRGIERYGQLGELAKADNIYPRLFDLFARADKRYNSGLFHFEPEKGRPDPDTFTPTLTLDDKVLKDIFKNLYYPDSPYEFSVLPADILGQVYEQFLGKVIRLTAGGQAKVEDKPEVKKAGGVYYTPTYIVEYIVRQTVGKLVEGQTPAGLGGKQPLRVLDPACGSGSFLLGAYQFLLDWYLNWYLRNNPDTWAKKKNAPIYPAPTTDPAGTPNWKLTIDERKRILLTHLYGVDIDPQAVEVTKLSLLLKVLEDEQSVVQQLGLFQERVLPDLDHNIKCGNSLIGPDFYQSGQLALFDEEENYRINAFDWQKEFPQVFAGEALTPNPSPSGRGGQSPRLPSPPGRGAGGEGVIRKLPLPKELLQRCRELRRNATNAEQLLWKLLCDRQVGGAKFRRQHPLAGYILDFYCHEAKLAIELDGGGHIEKEQARYDAARTQKLADEGVKVLRFWNNEVLQNTQAVLETIWEALTPETLTPTLSQREREQRLPSPPGTTAGRAGGEGHTGGFDVVIGNPPYGAWFEKDEDSYFSGHYSVFGTIKDVYICFMEQSFRLLKDTGELGLIIPSAWMGGPAYANLRTFLLHKQGLRPQAWMA